MAGILEIAAVKFLVDKIKEQGSSEAVDRVWKPVGQFLDSGQEKFLELWGRIDPEFADLLRKAIARAYVQAVRETTENYLKSEERRILRAESDISAQSEIKARLKALMKKDDYEIAPVVAISNITPAAGFDDDQELTRKLMTTAKADLGALPEPLQSALERELLRNLRHKLWIELSKSLKDGKSSSLMNAFLFDLLTRVGQSANTARIYSTRLAAQLTLELQLDRFELDQDLLRVKTRFFVNRAQVFREIEEFLKTSSGYFVVRAQGGLGKTAVSAKYILNNSGCIYHFLTRELGPQFLKPAGYTIGSPRNTIEECLRMLSQQLESRMGLAVSASADLRLLENRFNKLLRTWVEERPDEKLVIVIDGLDEAEHLEQFFKHFPERPLNHIYFILTTRPLVNIPQEFRAKAIELSNLSMEDVREMVAQANEILGNNEGFIRNLHEITGGHPLYLYHVVDEVFNRPEEAQQFLDKIPEGAIKNVDEYYRWQLKRLVSTASDDERRVGQDTLDLLRILLLLKEAITKEQLQEIFQIGSGEFARAFSRASRYMISSSTSGKIIYALFHPKFHEVVQENFSRLPKTERKACLQKIINYCAQWRERRLEGEADSNDYTFRHYSVHLYELAKEMKSFDPLIRLLQDKDYLQAKIERFGRYSAVLPDIRLAIEGAAAGKSWFEALRFCLLEGYVREAAKQKWQTGCILLDAVEGNSEFAVEEARAISNRDARGLQLLLIAEWLLLRPDDQSHEQGKKLIQETIELWNEERPFVTHEIEEGIMDFVTNILFKKDPGAAQYFLSILNVPGDAQELGLLLLLGKLDQEGFFQDPPSRSLTGDEYDQVVLCSKQICNTLIWRRKYPYGDNRDAPLAEYGTKDHKLAQAVFELATGQASQEIELDDLHKLSHQIRNAKVVDLRKVRAPLRTIWRSWQLRRHEKYKTRLPEPQKFIAETPEQGFLPVYPYLRSYLPILTQSFASQINNVLRTRIDSAPPFSDLLRFYMAKETASMDFQLSQEIATQIERPLLRGMAHSYVADLKGVMSDLDRKKLLVKVFEDLNMKDDNSRDLLYFDYREELIHSLGLLARSGESLSWMEVINKHFYEEEALLVATKVWFGSGDELADVAEPEWLRVRLPYQIQYFSRDEDVLDAPGYLAETARGDRGGLEKLNTFLKDVRSYCEREYGSVESPESQQLLAKLYAHEAFILFLLNLTRALEAEDLDQLRHVTRDLPYLKRLKVLSGIALRWQQLGNQKGTELQDEIISEYKQGFIAAELSSYNIRRDILPTLGNMHQVSPEKSSAAFQLLADLLKLESVAKRGPDWVFADWSYAMAASADRIERADICERYLKLGITFAKGVTNWPDESTLNTIGRDLEGIKNPTVLDSLFILLRGAGQFQRAAESYQTALAHAAAHFAKAMVNISKQPLGQAREIEGLLQGIMPLGLPISKDKNTS